MIPTLKRLFLATVRQYAVDFMVEEGFAASGIDVQEQWLLETAMRSLRISFHYPAKVLQENREIARYPATLWSYILVAIGLKKYATYAVVRLNEHLAFPSIELPPELKIGATLCYDYRTTLEPVTPREINDV